MLINIVFINDIIYLYQYRYQKKTRFQVFWGRLFNCHLIVSYIPFFLLYAMSTGHPQFRQLYSMTSSVILVRYFHVLPHWQRRYAAVRSSSRGVAAPQGQRYSVIGSFLQNPLISPHSGHLIRRKPLCPLFGWIFAGGAASASTGISSFSSTVVSTIVEIKLLMMTSWAFSSAFTGFSNFTATSSLVSFSGSAELHAKIRSFRVF